MGTMRQKRPKSVPKLSKPWAPKLNKNDVNYARTRSGTGHDIPPEMQDMLDLSNSSLPVPLPDLSALKNLHKLILSNSGLQNLAWITAARSTLTLLDVKSNPDLAATTDAWGGLKLCRKLLVLNASSCGLKSIPAEFAYLADLKAVILAHNHLETIEHIVKLSEINSCILSHNNIKSVPNLSGMRSLKKLALSHNNLSGQSLPDLSALLHLTAVNISHNPGISILPDHIKTWGQGRLDNLNISDCGLTTVEAFSSVWSQANITHVGLKGNPLSDESQMTLKGLAQENLPSLKVMDDKRVDSKHKLIQEKRKAHPFGARLSATAQYIERELQSETPSDDNKETQVADDAQTASITDSMNELPKTRKIKREKVKPNTTATKAPKATKPTTPTEPTKPTKPSDKQEEEPTEIMLSKSKELVPEAVPEESLDPIEKKGRKRKRKVKNGSEEYINKRGKIPLSNTPLIPEASSSVQTDVKSPISKAHKTKLPHSRKQREEVMPRAVQSGRWDIDSSYQDNKLSQGIGTQQKVSKPSHDEKLKPIEKSTSKTKSGAIKVISVSKKAAAEFDPTMLNAAVQVGTGVMAWD